MKNNIYICCRQTANKMKQKLTAKEEMLMNIFWEHGSMFIRDLIGYIPEPKPHYNTVATLVKFLEEKGFLEREPMKYRIRSRRPILQQLLHFAGVAVRRRGQD